MKAIYNSNIIVPISSIGKIEKIGERTIYIYFNRAYAGDTYTRFVYDNKDCRDRAFEEMIKLFEG